MSRKIPFLLLLCVFLLPVPEARADKAEVLGKIDALLAAGELDEAKRMIDFFLRKNPGDAEIRARLETWRIRKGDLGPILGEEGLEKPGNRAKLRGACLRIVKSTMAGNPEEWDALPHALSADQLKELLLPFATTGTPEDRRKAAALLNPPPDPGEPGVEEILAWIRTGPEECKTAFRWAERLAVKKAKPFATKVFAESKDPELRAAAAGALLALGVETPRKALLADLAGSSPVRALEALKVLTRHPGKGKSPVQGLWEKVEASEVVGRVKPTLYAVVIEALGASGEAGAREFLEKLLGDATYRVDAARALGARGDEAAIPALLAYLKDPPPEGEGAAGGGLDFLGGSSGAAKAAAADSIRPVLVGAVAILRITNQG